MFWEVKFVHWDVDGTVTAWQLITKSMGKNLLKSLLRDSSFHNSPRPRSAESLPVLLVTFNADKIFFTKKQKKT